MSKNGFYHERPGDEDIYVADHMISEVGASQINWHVSNHRREPGLGWVADVEWEGKTFIAVDLRRNGAADAAWTIVISS